MQRYRRVLMSCLTTALRKTNAQKNNTLHIVTAQKNMFGVVACIFFCLLHISIFAYMLLNGKVQHAIWAVSFSKRVQRCWRLQVARTEHRPNPRARKRRLQLKRGMMLYNCIQRIYQSCIFFYVIFNRFYIKWC